MRIGGSSCKWGETLNRDLYRGLRDKGLGGRESLHYPLF